jgi:dTDP-4-dehydrorhamnose reductase
MKSKILIFGKGFIGSRLKEELGCAQSDRRIATFKDIEKEVARYNPKVIINCIGHTGAHNVDDCEKDQDLALQANTYVPLLLAEVALRRDIKLVHISSGCIYHYEYGKNAPIKEERVPDFFNLYYSRTKIYAERSLDVLSGRYNMLILRLRIPLDDRPHPRNILTKLIGFKQVINIPNSVTYLPDFMRAVRHLLAVDARGIYNVVNPGGLRYPELLAVYKKHVPVFNFNIIEFKKLRMDRTNLILSTRKLEKCGFHMRPIGEVLEECVKNYLSC